jgi:pSer/pThr/pTyr-binding forkhead associated (FHA) protein
MMPALADAPATLPQPIDAPAGALAFQHIRMLIQPAGAEVVLPRKPEVIIGRADAASQFFPDVDLGSFDALTNGVSRRHARVSQHGDQVVLEDLDTANGTAINRQRLAPRQPQPIRDGDEVRFGKLIATVRLG